MVVIAITRDLSSNLQVIVLVKLWLFENMIGPNVVQTTLNN